MEMNEKIKSLRLQKGLTLEQVGDYVGVGKATVLKWESGIIQNMRRDKIAKLAEILGTTPDYLIEWEPAQDEWTKKFCQSVDEEMMSNSCTEVDYYDAGINYKRLSEVAGGVNNISLSEACSIADELGCSLDDMVGIKTTANVTIDGRAAQFLDLFNQLSEEKQNFILASIKGLLSD